MPFLGPMLFQKSQVGWGVRLLSRKLTFAQNRGKAVPTLRIRTYLYEDRQTFQESEQVFHFSSKAEALTEADRITEAFLSQGRAEENRGIIAPPTPPLFSKVEKSDERRTATLGRTGPEDAGRDP